MCRLVSGRGLRLGGWLAALATGIAVGVGGDRVAVDGPLRIVREGADPAIAWQLPSECGADLTLQSAADLDGPWSLIADAPEPLLLRPTPAGHRFFRAALRLPDGAADSAKIARSIRAYAFAANPRLNPATTFDIRIKAVRELWETLQVQLVDVRYCVDGHSGYRSAYVLRHGAVKPLGLSFGGHGLASGLVKGGSFYFTYSWGSGIPRSHIGELRIVNGQVTCWDTGGVPWRDLFVTRASDGEIAVVSGVYQSFNRWHAPLEYGRIDASDPAATKVVGAEGSLTLRPTEY